MVCSLWTLNRNAPEAGFLTGWFVRAGDRSINLTCIIFYCSLVHSVDLLNVVWKERLTACCCGHSYHETIQYFWHVPLQYAKKNKLPVKLYNGYDDLHQVYSISCPSTSSWRLPVLLYLSPSLFKNNILCNYRVEGEVWWQRDGLWLTVVKRLQADRFLGGDVFVWVPLVLTDR